VTRQLENYTHSARVKLKSNCVNHSMQKGVSAGNASTRQKAISSWPYMPNNGHPTMHISSAYSTMYLMVAAGASGHTTLPYPWNTTRHKPRVCTGQCWDVVMPTTVRLLAYQTFRQDAKAIQDGAAEIYLRQTMYGVAPQVHINTRGHGAA
jgi:hypothetical protein